MASTPTRKIFNATTQQVEDATLTVDHNNEIVATFENGSFVKFPAGLTAPGFEAQISLLQKHSSGQEVITPEAEAAVEAERANSLALIGAAPAEPPTNGNTMPEGVETDDPPTPDGNPGAEPAGAK